MVETSLLSSRSRHSCVESEFHNRDADRRGNVVVDDTCSLVSVTFVPMAATWVHLFLSFLRIWDCALLCALDWWWPKVSTGYLFLGESRSWDHSMLHVLIHFEMHVDVWVKINGEHTSLFLEMTLCYLFESESVTFRAPEASMSRIRWSLYVFMHGEPIELWLFSTFLLYARI